MAKRGNSVIGIDLGKHVFKGVLLHRKSDARYVLTSFASREVPEELTTADDLAEQLKLLFRDLGGSAKGCAIAVSDPDSLLRIIEQPKTPVDLLRNALRLNGLAVLNQECKDFVLDCAPVSVNGTNGANGHAADGTNGNAHEAAPAHGAGLKKYLVCGMLRPTVKQISDAMSKARVSADILQLAPICSFNAFEFAYPQVLRQRSLPPARHGTPAKHGPDRQQKGTGPRAQHRLRRQIAHAGPHG